MVDKLKQATTPNPVVINTISHNDVLLADRILGSAWPLVMNYANKDWVVAWDQLAVGVFHGPGLGNFVEKDLHWATHLLGNCGRH